MFKELVFELSEGQPDGSHTRFFYERPLVARMRVIHATPQASWELVHATGRTEDVTELRERLEEGPEPPMDDVEVVASAPRSLQYVVKWRREGEGTSQGVPLDMILHDIVGPDAMYAMSIQKGRIQITAAASDGEKLLTFYNRVRGEMEGRFNVRLVRVGELSATWDGDELRRGLENLRSEDRDLVELALTSGYYDNPKRCGVRELGDALGCSKSVVARKLRSIERKALESLLRPGSPVPGAPAAWAMLRGESPVAQM